MQAIQTTAFSSAILGVDVGKDELVVSLLVASTVPIHHALSVPNTSVGLSKLQRWCAKSLTSAGLNLSSLLVVMEATNVYWEKCAHHFSEVGCRVRVVNPAQVKFFAKSTLRRGKTDAMDAQLIAQFGAAMHPDLWQPPRPCGANSKPWCANARPSVARSCASATISKRCKMPILAAPWRCVWSKAAFVF